MRRAEKIPVHNAGVFLLIQYAGLPRLKRGKPLEILPISTFTAESNRTAARGNPRPPNRCPAPPFQAYAGRFYMGKTTNSVPESSRGSSIRRPPSILETGFFPVAASVGRKILPSTAPTGFMRTQISRLRTPREELNTSAPAICPHGKGLMTPFHASIKISAYFAAMPLCSRPQRGTGQCDQKGSSPSALRINFNLAPQRKTCLPDGGYSHPPPGKGIRGAFCGKPVDKNRPAELAPRYFLQLPGRIAPVLRGLFLRLVPVEPPPVV